MFGILRDAGKYVIGCALVFAMIAAPNCSRAATEIVLHKFKGYPNDGAGPVGNLLRDKAGNLYGTTYYGGTLDVGIIFEIAADGTYTILNSFQDNGGSPRAGLIKDRHGNMYGTASGNAGCGEVFELQTTAVTALHAFSGGSGDGCRPEGNLFMDGNGNLYGTTSEGGPKNAGSVFKLAPDSTETILHFFSSTRGDGADPEGGLIMDKNGNLFGTTVLGGGINNCEGSDSGCGTVFEIAPDGTETVIHRFGSGNHGAHPFAALLADAAGNLFGTASNGGPYACVGYGCGTVFELAPDGTETVLHSFTGKTDGAGPMSTLITDAAGNLYGTTDEGGTKCDEGRGCGTVFNLAPDRTETVLYAFIKPERHGANPYSGLIMDSTSNLYGTTYDGGDDHRCAGGCGTVFKITP